MTGSNGGNHQPLRRRSYIHYFAVVAYHKIELLGFAFGLSKKIYYECQQRSVETIIHLCADLTPLKKIWYIEFNRHQQF